MSPSGRPKGESRARGARGSSNEQGVHQRVRRGRGPRPGSRRERAAGREELHHPGRLPAPAGGACRALGGRAAEARRDDRLGGVERRPLRERRLHLRQAPPAGGGSPRPFPLEADRHGRGGGQRRARRRSRILRGDGRLPRPGRGRARGEYRRHRRGRPGARAGVVDLPDRQGAAQGARGRRGDACGRPRAPRRSRCSRSGTTSSAERHPGGSRDPVVHAIVDPGSRLTTRRDKVRRGGGVSPPCRPRG